MQEQHRIAGLLLIVGGSLWALVIATDLDGTVVVPGVGIAFLVAYLVTRRFGLLVPGGIVTGLGIGLVVTAQGGPDAAPLLGLGLGFLSISAIDRLFGDGDLVWWPLIPGGILSVLGGAQIAGRTDAGRFLVPAALILVGLVLLLRPARRRSGPDVDGG